MSKSFREKIEALVFAGLKPGAASSQPKQKRWLGPLRGPLERFLNAGGSDDPRPQGFSGIQQVSNCIMGMTGPGSKGKRTPNAPSWCQFWGWYGRPGA